MRTSPSQRVGWRYLVLTLASLGGAVWIAWRYQLSLPATVVTLLPGLGTSYLAWAQFRADRQEAASAATGQMTLGLVADQLAIALRTQWEAEAAHQRLNDPHPLPVAWQPADPTLVESWYDLIVTAEGWPGGPRTDPAGWAVRPAELAGIDNDLADVLSRVPTGRLVVLGEPGAGKTMLLVRLLLDLLARRHPGGLVPVLLPLATWDPVADDLTTWLTRRLVLDHPGLAEPAPPGAGATTRVQALLDHRLLLPILDGLDELPEQLVGRAITRINAALPPGQGLVLASRLTAYLHAVTGQSNHTGRHHPGDGKSDLAPVRLWGAAGIILRPLAPVDVRAYLRRDAASPVMAARWDSVSAALGSNTPLGQALTTPLAVALARTIYNPRPGEHLTAVADPGELCDQVRFPNSSAIQAHLFDALVPAAYRPYPDRRRRGHWTADQAGRWLRFLARHLHHDRNGTTDIAWWQLHHALPSRTCGLTVGLTVGLMGGLVGGLVSALVDELVAGFTGGFVGGFTGGLVLGVVVGLVGWRAGRLRREATPAKGLRWSWSRVLDGLSGGLAVGLVLGFVLGFVGFASGVAGLTGGFDDALTVGLTLAIALGLTFGIAGGLTGTAADLMIAAAPGTVLARDRRAFLAVALAGGLVGGLAFGLMFGRLGGGLVVGLVGGLVGGISEAAWGWFGIARCLLAVQGRLPWRVMTFLADAHQRGVLRQAGAVYQFRHIELQRYLVTRP